MNIREYKDNDYNFLKECLVKLNQYVTLLDPDEKIYTSCDYKEVYTNELLKLINENDGIIYILETDADKIGIIAGIIEKYSTIDNTHYKSNKEGRVLELYLEENYRGRDDAKIMMEKMEQYFKDKKCDFIRIDVFEYNEIAKKFYKKHGYKTRNIEMCKKL